MKIHILDMPNCKRSMDMHNMKMLPLICDADKKLSKSFPSKTNIQNVLLLNQTTMNHLIASNHAVIVTVLKIKDSSNK